MNYFLPLSPASTPQLPFGGVEARGDFALTAPAMRSAVRVENVTKLVVMPKPAPPASGIPQILSPSTVNLFLDCSARFHYQKVLGLPQRRGAALGLGTAVDAAITENFRQKVHTRKDLPTDQVLRHFAEAMQQQFDEITLEPTDDVRDLVDCGQAMIETYMLKAAPTVMPADVQVRVEGKIGNVPVQGYIDILDVNGCVIDVKTAAKKPSGIDAGYRLQVATYAMLESRSNGKARVSTLTKTKTVALHESTVQVGRADRLYAERIYSIAQDQMRTGLIVPNRRSHLCSRKYCSFADICCEEFGGEVA